MNEALTVNDLYAGADMNNSALAIDETNLKSELYTSQSCGCDNKVKERIPKCNGSLSFDAPISKEEFLEKTLLLIKYAKSIGLETSGINISQW